MNHTHLIETNMFIKDSKFCEYNDAISSQVRLVFFSRINHKVSLILIHGPIIIGQRSFPTFIYVN